MKFSLVCRTCSHRYPLREPVWRCVCGSLLDLEREGRFHLESVAGWDKGIWRYREFLPPVKEENRMYLGEGSTPLVPLLLDGRTIWAKQEQCSPTGSFKDRGAAVLISMAKEIGISRVVEDSSGNAGCAIAAYSAHAGIRCQVFVPESTSPSKLVQMRSYGAEITRVPGSRRQAAEAALAAAEKSYYASHSWNPLFFEGTKTIAYELYEQLGLRVPDSLVLAVGNGTLLLALWIGFSELKQAGLAVRVPRFYAIQAAACNPLMMAWKEKQSIPENFSSRPTLAEGIAVSQPVRGGQILEVIDQSEGAVLDVDEQEIREALLKMSAAGFLIEPTAAATVAGCRKILPELPSGETVATFFTGHGLKAVSVIADFFK